MRTLLTVIALVFAIAIAHAQPAPVAPQTTVLYGYVYRTNLTAAAGAIIITERTIPLASQPFVIGQAQRRDTANAAGFISMRVLRNSIVYISAADRTGYLGIPASPGAVRITIPDADSVMLVTDTSTIAIPQTHVLARPLLTLSDGITSGAISALTITGSSVGSVTFNGASASIVLNGGASTDYGDSIRVADSLARMRRTFVSRISTAITLDSSTDAAGRIYYTVSLHPDSVQAWLRDSSMTWMLGRVVQLADSGIAERGYMTPTQIRTLLAGYSVTGHAHAIADVSGLATALGDTVSYRDRMTKVEGSLAVILDTINAVKGRLATVVSDLNAHIGAADAHLPSQTGQAGKLLGTNGTVSAWQPEADPVYAAAAPTLRSKGDTLIDVRQTHLEMPNLTHILTADSNKTICVDGSGRLYLCWKGSGGAAVIDTNRTLPVGGSPKFTTGRLSLNTTETRSALNIVGGLRADSLKISGTPYDAIYSAGGIYSVGGHGGASFLINGTNDVFGAYQLSFRSGNGGSFNWDNDGAWYGGKDFVFRGRWGGLGSKRGMSTLSVRGAVRSDSTVTDTLVVQEKATIKTAVIDSVVAAVTVIDTTHYQDIDSIRFNFLTWRKPISEERTRGYDLQPQYSRYGWVEYDFFHVRGATSAPFDFLIVPDTANGVVIHQIEAWISTVTDGVSNYNPPSHVGTQWNYAVSAEYTGRGSGTGISHLGSKQIRYSIFNGASQDNKTYCVLRIYYLLTKTTNTDAPIKFASN